jgi:hypothetical protein
VFLRLESLTNDKSNCGGILTAARHVNSSSLTGRDGAPLFRRGLVLNSPGLKNGRAVATMIDSKNSAAFPERPGRPCSESRRQSRSLG